MLLTVVQHRKEPASRQSEHPDLSDQAMESSDCRHGDCCHAGPQVTTCVPTRHIFTRCRRRLRMCSSSRNDSGLRKPPEIRELARVRAGARESDAVYHLVFS
jgi:hypothetical protein